MKLLRIGTRGSALGALAGESRSRTARCDCTASKRKFVRIRTSGDRFQAASLAQIGAETGTKGIFIKEIEDALLAGTVDLAVHSMKDVPTETPAGLVFAAIPKREDPRDCLISRERRRVARTCRQARASAPAAFAARRSFAIAAPISRWLTCAATWTRALKKSTAGEFDAIVLAVAGRNSAGTRRARITQNFDAEVMLPAVGQGALGIETRADDAETSRLVAALDDPDTRACVTAERALLRELEGGCQVPLGAWARILDGVHSTGSVRVFSRTARNTCAAMRRGPPPRRKRSAFASDESCSKRGADRILRLAGRPVGRKLTSPSGGKRIVVTRAPEQAEELIHALQKWAPKCCSCPPCALRLRRIGRPSIPRLRNSLSSIGYCSPAQMRYDSSAQRCRELGIRLEELRIAEAAQLPPSDRQQRKRQGRMDASGLHRRRVAR